MYEKVARGDLNSCKPNSRSRAKRSPRIDAIKPITDDEDYDQMEEGSGVTNDDDDDDLEEDYDAEEYEDDDDYDAEDVEDIWDDENMVICDNIERKYISTLT